MYTHDIIIVGGGIVGSLLACALAKQTSLSIAILEAKPETESWDSTRYAHRVSAITLASQHMLQALQVWDAIKMRRVSPFTQIEVWDAKTQGEIHFHSDDIAEPFLGHIIENNVIQSALMEKLKQYPQIEIISPVKLVAFKQTEASVTLIDSDDNIYQAKLAIAADGAHSWLREQAGISVQKEDYAQEAIVATVQTDLPHQRIARQVFKDTGPLAFLPLASAHLSSIVWSLPVDLAKKYLALAPADFNTVLAQAFSERLGKITDISNRYAFPLYKQEADRYIATRLALVGDAAHTLHPLAGQGVNIGLLDAASLAEVISDAFKSGRDFANQVHLRRYERWRKGDNAGLLFGVHAIKNVFASDQTLLQQLRVHGMKLTHQMRLIKAFFTRHAVGRRAGLPKLAERPL